MSRKHKHAVKVVLVLLSSSAATQSSTDGRIEAVAHLDFVCMCAGMRRERSDAQVGLRARAVGLCAPSGPAGPLARHLQQYARPPAHL